MPGRQRTCSTDRNDKHTYSLLEESTRAMTPPILYLIFNRPDLMEQSFVPIREAQPAKLFIAADGPRADREGEAARCAEARRIVEKVDWPCEVKTLFREKNLGCRKAVSEAIAWFFENVEEGIILEDDCVADASFFPFCAELLQRYREDERIMAISGDNFQPDGFDCGYSYYFSKYPHCWGWATWRRAWAKYDDSMKGWPACSREKSFKRMFYSRQELAFWANQFNRVMDSKSIWDYVWVYTCWSYGCLSILPAVNLVENVGFGENATHTHNDMSDKIREVRSIRFPLVHPKRIIVSKRLDKFTDEIMFSGRKRFSLLTMRRIFWKMKLRMRRVMPCKMKF